MSTIELARPDAAWPPDMLPKRYELAGLRPGAVVRLYHRSGGAIWCRIVEHQRQEKRFIGEVEDTLAEGVRRGDRVTFRKENIFEVA